MEKKLLDIFRSVFNEEEPESICLDSEFREFEQYSSLTQMTIISKIQEEMGIKLKLLPLIEAETISDILYIIEGGE